MPTVSVSGSIFAEGWDGLQIVLFVYLLDRADAWGLVHERPEVFSVALGHPEVPFSRDDVRQRLDALVAAKALLRYEKGGQHYLAIRRFQDHQGRKYFPKRGPNCPIPPVAIIRKLSEKTRRSFGKCAGQLSGEVAVAVAVEVKRSEEKQQAAEYFHERLQNHLGLHAPEFPWERAKVFFARRLSPGFGDTLQDLKETTDIFFDDYIREKSAANFGHYQRVYNALGAMLRERREQDADGAAKQEG